MCEYKKWVTFSPAFDKRDSDPEKNYGIHGVNITFYLKGERGVIQFVLYTNWQLPHVQKELDSKMPDPETPYYSYKPLPADIGYHSPVPTYEGQSLTSDKCELLDGQKCYYDGSSLQAEEVFNVLCEGGDEAVWDYLEKYYEKTFETAKEEKGAKTS